MWFMHARRAAGRRGDVEAVGRQPADDAVVVDEAVLAQHDAVAAAAGLELLPRVGVEQFHELRPRPGRPPRSCRASRRRTGRRVSRTVAHSRLTAACMSSPACGKYQARFHWPTSSNTAPCASAQAWIGVRARRVEQRPARMVDDRAEGHRRVGRAEGGEADLGDRPCRAPRRRSPGRACWRSCPGRSPCRWW